MSRSEPTDEQLQTIMEGEAAARVLNDEAFRTVYDAALRILFKEWRASSPEMKEERESLYMQALGVETLTRMLHRLVSRGKAVNARLSKGTD